MSQMPNGVMPVQMNGSQTYANPNPNPNPSNLTLINPSGAPPMGMGLGPNPSATTTASGTAPPGSGSGLGPGTGMAMGMGTMEEREFMSEVEKQHLVHSLVYDTLVKAGLLHSAKTFVDEYPKVFPSSRPDIKRDKDGSRLWPWREETSRYSWAPHADFLKEAAMGGADKKDKDKRPSTATGVVDGGVGNDSSSGSGNAGGNVGNVSGGGGTNANAHDGRSSASISLQSTPQNPHQQLEFQLPVPEVQFPGWGALFSSIWLMPHSLTKTVTRLIR
ncbi:hypothetical protein BT69DRAFT_1129776 [Atractiella rhizophila]|nr:hypothetical protein BT69DRAFT_1129776 [Atractiella rhizophila]